jgi:hypothetical protein
MKLVELQIENIKRIKAVEIHPGPGVTAIGGRNAQGKTCVLDSIEMALAGERSVQPQPVRQGQESGRTVLTFDSGLVVKREFDAGGGSRLVVSDPSGKVKAPQTFLDTLTGKGIAFDPLAFLRMEPIKQLATLKRLVGVDFMALDEERKRLESERALAGRDVTGRKTQIESMPQYPGVPAEEVNVGDVATSLQAAIQHNRQLDNAAGIADRAADAAILAAHNTNAAIATATAKAKRADDEIARWQAYRTAAVVEVERESALRTRDVAASAAARANLAEANRAAEQTRIDEEPLKAQIATAEDTNRKVRANAARRQLERQFRDLKDQYEALTRQIDALDRDKAKIIGAAAFPVEGLGLGLQGVLYKGLPFEQASSAEQYRVSTAIGFELCPKTGESIRIGLIRDASLLDDDSRKIIAETAAKYDAQLILEVVTEDSGDADIIIEDGAVRAATPAAEEGVPANAYN